MRIRDRKPLYCTTCGGAHMQNECEGRKKNSGFPLETPSHNGEYRGTIPVRIIPPGITSEDGGIYESLKASRERQAEKFRKLRLSTQYLCVNCGKPRELATGHGKFCSSTCRTKYTGIHRNRRRAPGSRKTKWG